MQEQILVFGLPRSGTTWLGKLFDSHPDTLYRHEPDSVIRLERLPLFPTESPTADEREFIRGYTCSIESMRAPKVCAKLPLFQKSYLSGLGFAALQGSVALAKAGGRVRLKLPVVMAGAGARANGTRLVWKSIESLGRLGMILSSLETARAVHLIRHPCGSIASVRRGEGDHQFSDDTPSSEDWNLLAMLLETAPAKRRGLTMEHMRLCTAAQRMAWRWVLINEKAMDEAGDADHCRVIRYEDLCSDPVNEMKHLLDFCALPWHAQVEDFIARSTGGDRGGYYGVFKDPHQSAEKWKQELDRRAIDQILAITLDSRPGALFA